MLASRAVDRQSGLTRYESIAWRKSPVAYGTLLPEASVVSVVFHDEAVWQYPG